MDYEHYFSKTYFEAREKFRKTCNKNNLKLEEKKISNDLTIDFAYYPSKQKKKLILIVSGTHGVEGFTGSAVQLWFIDEIFPKIKDEISVAFVHILNPYGMHHLRRYNENNVDLNRNCIENLKILKTIDPLSTKIINTSQDILTPQRKRKNEIKEFILYYTKLIKKIIKYGLKNTIKAAGFGQNLYPKSVGYAGLKREKSILIFIEYIKKISINYKQLLFIDLHTGSAKKYKQIIFTKNKYNSPQFKFLKKISKKTKYAYKTNKKGIDHLGGLENIIFNYSKAKENIDLTIEYGTVNKFSTVLSLNYLAYILVAENQITHYGPLSKLKKNRRKIKNAYSPSNKKYKKSVINNSRKLFKKIIIQFKKY
jgi:hypothetical protein